MPSLLTVVWYVLSSIALGIGLAFAVHLIGIKYANARCRECSKSAALAKAQADTSAQALAYCLKSGGSIGDLDVNVTNNETLAGQTGTTISRFEPPSAESSSKPHLKKKPQRKQQSQKKQNKPRSRKETLVADDDNDDEDEDNNKSQEKKDASSSKTSTDDDEDEDSAKINPPKPSEKDVQKLFGQNNNRKYFPGFGTSGYIVETNFLN